MQPFHNEKRYVKIRGKESTISLEPMYWRLIAMHAAKEGIDWREAVSRMLVKQPPTYKSRAGYLRYISSKLLLDKYLRLASMVAEAVPDTEEV